MAALTIQTNIASLIAQNNLDQTNLFQQNTIEALTSGYRINDSGDDPAGLAVANSYAAQISELTQGVSNANDGTATLQTIDGGLSNISSILNELQTLATQSASGTFAGSRTTLNNEYQSLLSEITRQASNIGLNAGGQYNSQLQVFIGGGGNSLADSQVAIDLSGANNGVDATSLGLTGTSLVGGGTAFTDFSGNSVSNLTNPTALFNVGNGAQTFKVQYLNASNQPASTTVTVNATADGSSGTSIVNQINSALQTAGVTGVDAQIGSDGTLQFGGSNLLSVTNGFTATSAYTTLTGGTNGTTANGAGTGATATTEALSLTVGGNTLNISLSAAAGQTLTASDAATDITNAIKDSSNSAIADSGITASAGTTTNGAPAIQLSGPVAFNLVATGYTKGAAGDGTSDAAAGSGGILYGYSNPTTTFGAIGDQLGVTSPTVAGGSSNTLINGANYNATGAFTDFGAGDTETLQVTAGGQNYTLALNSTNAGTVGDAVSYINSQLAGSGVTAISNGTGSNATVTLQGLNAFSVAVTSGANGDGTLFQGGTGAVPVTAPSPSSSTANAENAVLAVTSAIGQLGLTQGIVGAGEEDLSYATSLANSQITSLSQSESDIRDADMATEAANLTKAQVLEQASLAALAQANSAPSNVLALLKTS